MAQTTNDKMIEDSETNVGQDKKTAISFDASKPNNTPIIPPVMLITIASIKNCIRISIPLAPIDMRKPISFVRSVTDTYMIFMMPMPPTNNDMPAMAAKSTVSN